MVVMTDGLIDKREYKKFKMKKSHDNDFDMMREIISRRAKHTDWPRPDLIVIDGGAPQLRAVIETMQMYNLQSSVQNNANINLSPKQQKAKSSSSNSQLSILNYPLVDVPLIGIAKHPDRFIIPILIKPSASSNAQFSILNSQFLIEFASHRPHTHDLGFRLVQAIRDEAHRFAKKYHTMVRRKSQLGL